MPTVSMHQMIPTALGTLLLAGAIDHQGKVGRCGQWRWPGRRRAKRPQRASDGQGQSHLVSPRTSPVCSRSSHLEDERHRKHRQGAEGSAVPIQHVGNPMATGRWDGRRRSDPNRTRAGERRTVRTRAPRPTSRPGKPSSLSITRLSRPAKDNGETAEAALEETQPQGAREWSRPGSGETASEPVRPLRHRREPEAGCSQKGAGRRAPEGWGSTGMSVAGVRL